MFLFMEKCICQRAKASIRNARCHSKEGWIANEQLGAREGSHPSGGVTLMEQARFVFTNSDKGIFLS